MSSEFQLKLALAQEYQQAVKWKRDYETLTEEFLELSKELLRYCDENHAEIMRDEKVRRLMVRMGLMIKAISDGSFQPDDRRGLPRTSRAELVTCLEMKQLSSSPC